MLVAGAYHHSNVLAPYLSGVVTSVVVSCCRRLNQLADVRVALRDPLRLLLKPSNFRNALLLAQRILSALLLTDNHLFFRATWVLTNANREVGLLVPAARLAQRVVGQHRVGCEIWARLGRGAVTALLVTVALPNGNALANALILLRGLLLPHRHLDGGVVVQSATWLGVEF